MTGEDPARIEHLWHKIFRSFTYMGSRGAAVECVSAIDIALWDIRGKVLGKPIYELLGGPVRDEIALYTHPDQRKFTSKEAVVREIRDIVESGHTALKFDPFPHQGRTRRRRGPRTAGRLPRWQHDPQGRARGRRTHGSDPRNGGARCRNSHRCAWPLRRSHRHSPLPEPRGSRPDRLVRGALPAREPQRPQAGAREGQCRYLVGRARPHEVGFRAGAREQAGRLHHAGRHLDRRHYRTQEDFRAVRSLLHPGLATRRRGTDQRGCGSAGDDDRSQLLQARNVGVEPGQIRSPHRQTARQFERQPQAARRSLVSASR